jgi:Protein phosphatase 2C
MAQFSIPIPSKLQTATPWYFWMVNNGDSMRKNLLDLQLELWLGLDRALWRYTGSGNFNSRKGVRTITDHKPDVPLETARIVGLGGFVTPPPVSRVQRLLSISRSFGDFGLSPFVISDPEISGPFSLERWGAVVIGCDGIFDVMSDDEVGHHHFPLLCAW